VVFGRHFAAISGAGPLIGPVLAIQYGYMPGLLWLVIGVCLAGAVQDMLVLAASVRRDGRSLAEIARTELGRSAAILVSAAILFILIIALGAFGFVVVQALGGDQVRLTDGTQIILPNDKPIEFVSAEMDGTTIYRFPEDCRVRYDSGQPTTTRPEEFLIEAHRTLSLSRSDEGLLVGLPPGSVELIPGSSWGIFAIACTIPISLFMGWYFAEARKGGRIVGASVLGVIAVIAAVIVGNWIPGSTLESPFSLTKDQTVLALAGYGLIASMLPAWLLSSPRDYLSGILKIGTIVLLVVGVMVANPRLLCPPLNHQFLHGGPNFKGDIFPFVFICITGGSISGLHSLVCSGTTPKMVEKESQIRTIGYGAMLMEGLVGIVALITAAALGPRLYYDINTSLPDVPKYQRDLDELHASQPEPREDERDLSQVHDMVEGEALRGRTGGAVTFAVGMAQLLTDALHWKEHEKEGDQKKEKEHVESIMKYWYHFALVFEVLLILTTIDRGTRVARSLLQEALGKVHPKFERADWLPGALLASFMVTAAWAFLVKNGSIGTLWPMFGIANQFLAVVALAVVTTLLINSRKARYAPITLLPMLFVTATAMTAGVQMVGVQFPAMIHAGQVWAGVVNMGLTVFVMICAALLLLLAVSRWIAVLRSKASERI
jgi:carbon starvation protein